MAKLDQRDFTRLKALSVQPAPGDVTNFQLKRINAIWSRATSKIRYYAELKNTLALPSQFTTLREFVDSVPVLTRDIIQEQGDLLAYESPRPTMVRVTGGSTGTPVQIPSWRNELDEHRYDAWVGRSWYGIETSDRMFLYWGHGHLLGKGWKRPIASLIRACKDRYQNYVRHSCYDMCEDAMRRVVARIRTCRPSFIIGYSVCLDQLARFCQSESLQLSNLGIKAVIGAAEGLPAPDSRSVIQQVFGAPWAMEYGSVETNLIGHTHPRGGYEVFWWNNFLEAQGVGLQDAIVTNLTNRRVPLIRYRIGDRIQTDEQSVIADGGSCISFANVAGRCNQSILLPNGLAIHSEAASHVVRDNPRVCRYQFHCHSNHVELHLVVRMGFTTDDEAAIRKKARDIHADLERYLQIRVVDELRRTIAGKTPMIVNDLRAPVQVELDESLL